jgi:hypothetical protein
MRQRAMIVFSVLVVLLLVAAPAAAAPGPLPPHGGPVGGPPQACARYHMVRFGETLFSIGRMYGVSPWAIASANHLPNANRIFAGQCLCIPPRPPCPPAWCGCGPRCGWGW